MATRIAVVGAGGRMGREIARVCAGRTDVVLVGGVASRARSADEAARLGYARVVDMPAAAALLADADAVIDVSSPDGLAGLLERHHAVLAGRALVVGTTGVGAAAERALSTLAGAAPVLVAANFSVGVTVLQALVETAAAALAQSAFDAEIVETHHRGKADAPSGTALALAAAVARARGQSLETVRRDGRSGRVGARPAGEIGLHSVRGGGVVGEHRVQFLGERERVELSHAAWDRSVFAEGALLAASWLVDRPAGRYTMRDVLGL